VPVKKIMLVAGARPNFMKIAPILRAVESSSCEGVLVHTGQHYDNNMSDTFFRELGIKPPDFNLEAGSGSHAQQTAHIMVAFETLCREHRPDMVLVVGDVNSTIAAGLVAKKLNIVLAHVEAGLRSGDRTMPEEINRLATDAITDLFFTTEENANANLLREGQPHNRVHFVGHVMIDNLFYQVARLKETPVSPPVARLKETLKEAYLCMTMHRPANVDSRDTLEHLIDGISRLAARAPVVFPCHPRTKKMIEQFGLADRFTLFDGVRAPDTGIIQLEPLGYNDFLYLWKDCRCMLTDSGGLQEETTALKIPCITMRENTERPVTADIGSNVIVGRDVEQLVAYGNKAINGTWKESSVPPFWDGKASERIVKAIEAFEW